MTPLAFPEWHVRNCKNQVYVYDGIGGVRCTDNLACIHAYAEYYARERAKPKALEWLPPDEEANHPHDWKAEPCTELHFLVGLHGDSEVEFDAHAIFVLESNIDNDAFEGPFKTVAEAKQWCQGFWDNWVRQTVSVYLRQPLPEYKEVA